MEAQQVQKFLPCLPHHIKIMKIALAIAIVRRKPEGVSARMFTEQLALQFNQLQTDWKCKAAQLEAELLRTRQELVQCQLQSELPGAPPLSSLPAHLNHRSTNSQGGGGGGCIEASQSDSEWQSSGYCSSCPDNSQPPDQEENTCIEWREANGQQQLMEAGSQACLALEDSDGDNQSRLGLRGNQNVEETISNHMKFCISVSSLTRVQHHLSSVLHSDLQVTLRDTVLSAIKGLSQAIAGSGCVQATLLESSAENIVAIVQFPMMSSFEQELTDACIQLLTVLIDSLGATDFNTHAQSMSTSNLCKVISTMCCLPRLFQFAVEELTRHVSSTAHTLARSIDEDCSHLSPSLVDRVGALLTILEHLLTHYDASSLLLPAALQSSLAGALESSLLPLCDGFPLFVYSLWTLIAHLRPLDAF